jgi:hypothetical protein
MSGWWSALRRRQRDRPESSARSGIGQSRSPRTDARAPDHRSDAWTRRIRLGPFTSSGISHAPAAPVSVREFHSSPRGSATAATAEPEVSGGLRGTPDPNASPRLSNGGSPGPIRSCRERRLRRERRSITDEQSRLNAAKNEMSFIAIGQGAGMTPEDRGLPRPPCGDNAWKHTEVPHTDPLVPLHPGWPLPCRGRDPVPDRRRDRRHDPLDRPARSG